MVLTYQVDFVSVMGAASASSNRNRRQDCDQPQPDRDRRWIVSEPSQRCLPQQARGERGSVDLLWVGDHGDALAELFAHSVADLSVGELEGPGFDAGAALEFDTYSGASAATRLYQFFVVDLDNTEGVVAPSGKVELDSLNLAYEPRGVGVDIRL